MPRTRRPRHGASGRHDRLRPTPLEEVLAGAERDLAELAASLAQDSSPESGQDGLHRLIAVTSMINLGLDRRTSTAAGRDSSSRRPSERKPVLGAMSGVGSAPSSSPSRIGYDDTGLTGRLAGVAATLHRLVALVAGRIGATGYSIGVSLPAGLSVTIEFRLPSDSNPPSA